MGANEGLDRAAAVAVNVTITEPDRAGYVTAWASGSAQPETSNVNADQAGENHSNFAIVEVGSSGTINLFTEEPTHLIVDVLGYFTNGSSELTAAGLFRPTSPTRIDDSRAFGGAGRLAADSARLVFVGRPAVDQLAPVYNLTVTNTTGPGYVTAYPAVDAVGLAHIPNTSTVNYEAPQQSRAVLTVTPGNGVVGLYADSVGRHRLHH